MEFWDIGSRIGCVTHLYDAIAAHAFHVCPDGLCAAMSVTGLQQMGDTLGRAVLRPMKGVLRAAAP